MKTRPAYGNRVRLGLGLGLGTFLAWAAVGMEPDADQLAFFERRIRPVLVESCYPCHSAESGKFKGGLRVDSQAGLRRGGDSGPAVVVGEPDRSLLLAAIRYDRNDLRMPPEDAGGKLAPEVIADFRIWIRSGAADPRFEAAGQEATGPPAPTEARAEHWAFRPVSPSLPPVVNRREWIRTPIDAFILAELEADGMSPAPPADPRTWIRRVTYDLTGLPPEPDEVDAFLRDPSAAARAEVVDRLLASPHYGERWGRHWLDVARYADTKGYVFQEERRYPFSYTYRDYVIAAFNADKPYRRFLVEQIAADQVEMGEDRSALAAMGFLTLGRRFLNNRHDIIDDRIDVVTRGTMALTVACARCHDHKFDPISIEDYYALYGVFDASEEPEEKPLLGPLRETESYRQFLEEKEKLLAEQEEVARAEVRDFLTTERGRIGDYLLAAHLADQTHPDDLAAFAGQRKVIPRILERWIAFLREPAQLRNPVLAPWFALIEAPEGKWAAVVEDFSAGLADSVGGSSQSMHSLVVHALSEDRPQTLEEAAQVYNRLGGEIEKSAREAGKAGGAKDTSGPNPRPDPDREGLRQLLFAEDAPANLPEEEARDLIRRRIRNKTVELRKRLEALNWTHPGAPARGMVLKDRPNPGQPRVFRRGNPANPGNEVPRRFLTVLAGPAPPPFQHGSGRLELARAIASRDNPLTTRVWVNRVWGWHFGTGLVRNASDFGVRTAAPVQLKLLDWLAAAFMEQNWSTKYLHRLILLSNTYAQSSQHRPGMEAADPENNLWHRFPQLRLDFEAMRDSLLAASGNLDLTIGGQPVDIIDPPYTVRRTVYGFIDRQNLPGLFRTFDFANPDTTSPGRFYTTVPQQALFLMNSPFVLEQARGLVRRPQIQKAHSKADKVRALYRLLFQRPPESREYQLANQFLDAPTPTNDAWTRYAQTLLLSNEFAFLD